ncbi:hypothetical protein [Ferrovibrio sp.]|uniref:alpha/beta hydrolase family protein n=1 Tax=Ferrovibrio sp. TaxID=1917215 RepID=UPI001B5E129A|nr:hypothetical protein [Ferrovibrio sp.]MBP7062810.1 hypothetical protein [Ferrovibrio sp.]
MKRPNLALLLSGLLLAGCAGSLPGPDTALEAAPVAQNCPDAAPAGTRCLAGQDRAGAFYLIAIPADWNGHLVLHAHGGPELGAPSMKRTEEDFKRWSITVRAGYAWAGSSFRQGGVALRAAAEDTERLNRIFRRHVAVPKRTILHGQSWGAGVAAMGAEMYGRAYDGVLLTSGVLAGGTRSYDFRLDLRVVYQYLCNNHPAPNEPAYPLWQGLPEGAALTRPELTRRVNDCLGLDKPAAQRSPEQQAKVKTIADVIKIPERSIQGHLAWATWHFQDIAQKRTAGRSAFGNSGVRYAGSADDASLNAGVLRYRADPQAVASFGADTDPSGRIRLPVVTVKGLNDPTAFVELDAYFRSTMERAGQGGNLVQSFTEHADHSYLADPVYPALFAALLGWIETGTKPNPAGIAAACQALEARYGNAPCRFRVAYTPPALETRVPPRDRP